jgi:hypothetical protein
VTPTMVAQGVGLVQACDDRQLFGFPLWPRQGELLASLERGPRLQVWALGRRSGKTTMGAVAALWNALLRPDLDAMIRPGERRHAVAVATNLRQARLFVRAALSIVERSPLLRGLIESQSEDEIVFRNGAAITAFPCSSRGGRGWAISLLMMDEAAHFLTDTDGPAVAERVFNALVPATAQFGDKARVIASSTPWGQDGLFATLYQQAASGELTDAQAHHATTAEMNPTITASYLEQEERRDPDSFRSEYLAEFVGSGAAFLDPESIADAIQRRGELEPEDAVSWVAGIDPAFSSDPFGLAIVGKHRTDRGRLLLGLSRAWIPVRRKPTTFEETRHVEDSLLAEVAATIKRYTTRVITDQYKAAGVADRLRRFGLSVRVEPMTAPSKDAAFGFLKGRLNGGSLELYEQAELLAELRRLRTKYTASRSMVVNPRVGRSHGDMAQALALAVWEHDKHGLGGGKVWKQDVERPHERQISAGLADLGPGMVPRDSTRRRKWYDQSESMLGRKF